MDQFPILRDLGVVVIAAALLLFAARPLRVPAILAYMLAGLVLGPGLGVFAVSESVEVFSELGIALLLFVVGLEMSLAALKDVGRAAVVVGVAQVSITALLGGALALAAGLDMAAAVFIGLAAAFSSTVVVIKLLDRAGALGALHGRLAIGILLVQDVLVAVALTVVGGFVDGGGDSLGGGLAAAFLGIAALAVLAAAAVRFLLLPLFAWLAGSTEALFVLSLAWAFVFIVAAEMLHVSVELGAFVAGVALAQLPYNVELQRRVHPLVDFFLAVFFVSLGAGMDPVAAMGQLGTALLLSAFVLIGKPLIVAVLLGRMGHDRETSFLAGVTLGQISEFAFILTAMAAAGGLIGEQVLSLVGLVGLITIGTSSVLVPLAPRLRATLERRGALAIVGGHPTPPPRTPAPEGHVVVVGMNTLGRMLVERFADLGERVVAVDTDAAKLRGLPAAIVVGSVDSPALLREADVARARLVVSALQIEEANSMLAYRCGQLGVPVSIHAFDPTLVPELRELGARHLMISKHDGIRQMAAAFRRLGVIQ